MIHCIPGFLGRGTDFEPFLERLNATEFGGAVLHDPFHQPNGGMSLEAWGEGMATGVVGDASAALVGYSLGGRLALHALTARPAAWRAAVIVSAHTGLSTDRERSDRLAADRSWAERFENESWPDVMRAWNGRPVFGTRTPPVRREEDFPREALVTGLTAWSLGAQADLLPGLKTVSCPVLWVVGEDDERFRVIGERAVDRLPSGRLEVIPNAAHRVHVDAPDAFGRVLSEFLEASASAE